MLNKPLFNGNGRSIKISIGFVVTILFTVLFAIGGWGLLKVSEVPECFATKIEINEIKHDLNDSICSMEQRIYKRLDRIEDTLKEHIYYRSISEE